MQVVLEIQSSRLELAFSNEEELSGFVEQARERSAFLVPLPEMPAPMATYTVELKLEPDFAMELAAQVVQLFEGTSGGSAAFQIEPLSRSWDLEFKRRLRQAVAPADDHSEMTGQPPIVRIRKMTVPQRRLLATKADRIERAALIRDSSAQVLLALVTNPRVSADDIVQIIRNPQVSPGVLDRITRENRWLANSEIQKALVRNPKTPAPIAIRMVDNLPTEELRKLAKLQSGVREPLRKAALRVYLKRTRR